MPDVSPYGSLIANVSKYGVAAILLTYLVYMMANTLPMLQAKTIELIQQHEQMRGDISLVSRKVDESTGNTQKLLRGICLILASTQQDKQLCNP